MATTLLVVTAALLAGNSAGMPVIITSFLTGWLHNISGRPVIYAPNAYTNGQSGLP